MQHQKVLFLILCMKLEVDNAKKVTEPSFSAKFSFLVIFWLKNILFLMIVQNYFISFSWYFSQVRGKYWLKSNPASFFGKTQILTIYGHYLPQNGPFFKFQYFG